MRLVGSTDCNTYGFKALCELGSTVEMPGGPIEGTEVGLK